MAPMRALLVAAILLGGCQGTTPPGPTDPFFGPTRIPPPGTGTASSQPAANPYNPAPPQVTLPQGMMPLPRSSSATDPSASLVSSQPGDRVAIPSAAREFSDSSRQFASRNATSADSKSDSSSEAKLAVATLSTVAAKTASSAAPVEPQKSGRERIYQTIGPRPKDVVASSSSQTIPPTMTSAVPTSRYAAASRQPVDIMDLPSPSGIQLVSAIEEVKDSSRGSGTGAMQEVVPSRSLYGYDPQYGWLRGRLEYSQIDRRWKLRYIPIDGETDKFGGSVILTTTTLLSGYERGDFVEVHGKLVPPKPESRSFSADYEVQKIERVGK